MRKRLIAFFFFFLDKGAHSVAFTGVGVGKDACVDFSFICIII